MPNRARLAFSIALVTVGLAAAVIHAAETYKSGDKVEVLFLSKWRPAVVVTQNMRGEVLAEFEFTGPTRRVFKAPEVRWAYESEALSKGRLWSDTTGSFKIKAALTAVNEKEATLRKPDLSEVTIELEKLSDSDR